MNMPFDYVLVGGGLANGLLALALFSRRPNVRIALVEAAPMLGGDHLWCFHGGDVPADAMTWVAPLVATSWDRWSVRFPSVRRRFDATYAAVPSVRLDDVVVRAFADRAATASGSRLFLETRVTEVHADHVVLANGSVLTGTLVVDARGPVDPGTTPVGWQKFVGLELEVEPATAPTSPTVMDADVPQTDGFRFFYVLPLAPNRVMVEDTYYADDRHLDVPALREGILAYARAQGMEVKSVFRQEVGALPLPFAESVSASERAASGGLGPLRAGYGGGLFHPTTGYSFPIAVRLASFLAARAPEDALGPAWDHFQARHFRQVRFALLLNRLLFHATPAGHRRDVLERFHRLPDATIRRFYALETTTADRARIVCGRPPKGISLRAAMAGLRAP
jgi:lycopene beta-cyclase